MSVSHTSNYQDYPKKVIALSVPLAFLVTGASLVGLFSPDFYANETSSWQAQSIGQDLVDLILIVPLLITIALITFKNKKVGILLWGGVILYLIYTFTIYCFDIRFNKLFISYCLTLGLSFYSFLYFIYIHFKKPSIITIHHAIVTKVVGIYLITVAVIFYFLWLSEIIPSILSSTTPKILIEAGLPTNPVHVIDLAIFLPGIFIIGVLLLRNKTIGLVMTPVMLVFFILMDITIGALSAIMYQRGLDGSLPLTIAMSMLALISLALLIWYLKSDKSSSL